MKHLMTYESFSKENQIDEGFSFMSKEDKANLEKVKKGWTELMTKLGVEGDILEKFNKLNKNTKHKQKILQTHRTKLKLTKKDVDELVKEAEVDKFRGLIGIDKKHTKWVYMPAKQSGRLMSGPTSNLPTL